MNEPSVSLPKAGRRLRRKAARIRARNAIKFLIDEVRKNNPCVKCGSVENVTFHHRDKETKKFTIGSCENRPRSLVKIIREIMKCDPLCFPCHRVIHLESIENVVASNQSMLNQDCILQGAIAASQGQSPDVNPFQINRGSTAKASWEMGWLVQKLSDDHDETLLYRYSAPAGAD